MPNDEAENALEAELAPEADAPEETDVETEAVESEAPAETASEPEEAAQPATPAPAAAPTYTQDQMQSAVQRAQWERDRIAQQNYQRTLDQRLQQERQRWQEEQAKTKEQPGLPDMMQWLQDGGSPEMYKFLESLKQAPQTEVQRIRQEFDDYKRQQKQNSLKSQIETSWDRQTNEAAEKHEVFREQNWRTRLEAIVYSKAQAGMAKGMDPLRFDISAEAKSFATDIEALVKQRVDAKLKKLSNPGAPSVPRGSPTKPAKKSRAKTTEQTIDEGFDEMAREIAAMEGAS